MTELHTHPHLACDNNNKKKKAMLQFFLYGHVCAAVEWGEGVTLRGRTVYKKERKKKVIINHIYDALREPAFERMDDR